MWAEVLPKFRSTRTSSCAPTAQKGLGDPQGQPAARPRSLAISTPPEVKKQGVIPSPSAAVHEDPSGSCPNALGARGPESLRVDDRVVREVRTAVRLRPAGCWQHRATRSRMLGSEQEEPRRGNRRDAGHAGNGEGAQGWEISGNAEVNIHAGTKYMDQLMTRYFTRPRVSTSITGHSSHSRAITPAPATSAKMRAEAETRGLDPNKWFNNVETVDRREDRH